MPVHLTHTDISDDESSIGRAEFRLATIGDICLLTEIDF
jgi:hypothetical protein